MTNPNAPRLRKDRRMETYGGRVIKTCPVCGSPMQMVTREGGIADHYEPVQLENFERHLEPYPEEVQAKLREERKGKKTVAIVGMSPSSAGLAPYKEKDVECWGLNEAHLYGVMTRWDRWFQMHGTAYLMKNMSLRGKQGHWDWLGVKRGKPIYMQFVNPLIPDSVEFPLKKIRDKYLGHITHGGKQIKYFTSTFAYMISLALYEGFNRIEIYGFDMDMKEEYWKQRSCAELWIGIAITLGVDIVLPESSFVCKGILYGYRGIDYNRPVEPEDMDD